MASTPSPAGQLGLFRRMSPGTFLLKNLQCFKCLLLGSFQRQSRLLALSARPLVLHIPGSTQISHCKSFKCLLTVPSQRRPLWTSSPFLNVFSSSFLCVSIRASGSTTYQVQDTLRWVFFCVSRIPQAHLWFTWFQLRARPERESDAGWS